MEGCELSPATEYKKDMDYLESKYEILKSLKGSAFSCEAHHKVLEKAAAASASTETRVIGIAAIRTPSTKCTTSRPLEVFAIPMATAY